MMKKIGRRSFLKGIGAAGLACAAGLLTGCDSNGRPVVPSGDGSVSLATLPILNGDIRWNKGSPKDPFGNDYSYAVNYTIVKAREMQNCTDGVEQYMYGEYRIYKKYESISFTVAPYTEIAKNGTGYVQVYADDVLVATSPEMTRKTDAQKVVASVRGAEYIKIVIRVSCPDWYVSQTSDGAVIVSNVKLWKPQEE